MDRDFLRQIDQVEDLLPGDPADKLDAEILICECFCVSVEDIRKACAAARKVDISLLQARYGLGQGCQGCLKRMDSWVNKIF